MLRAPRLGMLAVARGRQGGNLGVSRIGLLKKHGKGQTQNEGNRHGIPIFILGRETPGIFEFSWKSPSRSNHCLSAHNNSRVTRPLDSNLCVSLGLLSEGFEGVSEVCF